MFIIAQRRIWYTLSALMLIASLAAMLIFGLRFGIDFTGGSILEVQYTGVKPTPLEVTETLESAGLTGVSVRATGDAGYLIRTPFLSPETYAAVRAGLGGTEVRYDAIGPAIGTELATRAIYAVLLVLISIALFIAFAFRKVSKPVSSFKYGAVALLSLAHDVIIPLGAFAVMGVFLGAEVDTLFVTALLVILGFSVHDTIVVFDRTRENLHTLAEEGRTEPFEETVGRSVSQTLARSINTSLTTVLALLALYIWGPESTKFFTLTLLIGIIAGTYSSIFLASPMLVTLQKLQRDVPSVDTKKKQ